MRYAIRVTVALFSCGLFNSCAAPVQTSGSMDSLLNELVTLECSALDRSTKLDLQGYLDLYAPDVTYFDVSTEQRIDGLAAMRARVASMKPLKPPPFTQARYELIAPRVQQHGDAALLTFNLVNYGKLSDGVERELSRWNCTEVYARVGSSWKIVHSHWSFVQPTLKVSAP